MDPNELHIASFMRSLRAKNRSKRTMQSYEEAILQLAKHHDGADTMEMDKAAIEDYLGAVLAEHSSATAGNRYRSLRAYFNWGVTEEIIDRSPMAGMKPPKETDEAPEIVSAEDVGALLRACRGADFEDRRDTAIIRLWLEPGSPRLEEMAGLAFEDLDMRQDHVTIHGKGDRVRIVPFGAKTGQALDRYLRMRAKHKDRKLPALWLGARRVGLTGSGLAQMLRRRCQQAGIKVLHPHQLRHTAAHNWFDADGSEADADELFGWSPSSRMGRIYGRSAKQERARRSARRKSLADRY